MKINEEVTFACYIKSNYLASKDLKNGNYREDIVDADQLEFLHPLFSLNNPDICTTTDLDNSLWDYPSCNSLYENEIHNYEKMKINGEIYTVKRGTADPNEIKTVKCEKCETKYSTFDYFKCPVCNDDNIENWEKVEEEEEGYEEEDDDEDDEDDDEEEEIRTIQENNPPKINNNFNEIRSSYKSKYSQEDSSGYYKTKNKLLSNWQCESCGFINNSLSSSCEICEQLRLSGYINDFIINLTNNCLIDCKDSRGIWYPAKVVERNKNKLTVHFRGWNDIFNEVLNVDNRFDKQRIAEYESVKSNYGLHLYTIQYFTEEKILNIINKLCNYENPDLKSIYIKNRSVYYTGLNEIAYEYKIISYDDDNKTLCLKTYNGILYDVPITMVELDRPKKRICIESVEEEEESSFTIPLDNIRNVVNVENNIDIATNRFITDFSRNTIYKNDDDKSYDFFFNNINN